MAASERVFKLLDTAAHHRLARTTPSPATRSGSIEFRNVWFTYQPLTGEQSAATSTTVSS